ncbi:MAG: hypothetical protein FJ096_04085 [Deltaproteobacteria bacterium]|nr:hypothetical protein [Deltaproteobacteria bacterium]
MSEARPTTFDPRGAILMDRDAGQLRVGISAPRVMVPAEALVTLCAKAGEELTVALGHALGEAIGARLRERFESAGGDGVRGGPFALVVEHLAGEVALSGLGVLTAERWGKALAFVVDHSPIAHEAIGDVMLCGVLSAAVRVATGASATIVPVAREGTRTRFLVLGDGALDGVLRELERGTGWHAIVGDLNGGAS